MTGSPKADAKIDTLILKHLALASQPITPQQLAMKVQRSTGRMRHHLFRLLRDGKVVKLPESEQYAVTGPQES